MVSNFRDSSSTAASGIQVPRLHHPTILYAFPCVVRTFRGKSFLFGSKLESHAIIPGHESSLTLINVLSLKLKAPFRQSKGCFCSLDLLSFPGFLPKNSNANSEICPAESLLTSMCPTQTTRLPCFFVINLDFGKYSASQLHTSLYRKAE